MLIDNLMYSLTDTHTHTVLITMSPFPNQLTHVITGLMMRLTHPSTC